MFHHYFTANRTRNKYQINNTFGKSGFFENLHQHLCRVNLCIGTFPNNHVTHHSRSCRKVAGNGSKVKRSECIHKTFQRTVFQQVPHSFGRVGLLAVNLRHVFNIKSEEISQLAGGIYFSLKYGFRLCQHGSGVDFSTIRS